MDKNRFLDSRWWTEAARVLCVTPVSELQQSIVTSPVLQLQVYRAVKEISCQSNVRTRLARVTQLSLYL